MASIKLSIYLVLLFAGTCLGCAIIRELNESRENLNLPPKPNEVESFEVNDTLPFMGGVPAAGTIIAGAELGVHVLMSILDAMGKIDRKLAVGIENQSGHKWRALNVYFESGTSDAPMPLNVPTGKALLYNARKTTGPTARGAVGVMAFYIPDLDKTLGVMFSVPYDYNLYGNWWNVNTFNGESTADYNMYKTMYYDSPLPFKGDNGWHKRNIGSGLKMTGAMASSGTSTLEIHVMKSKA